MNRPPEELERVRLKGFSILDNDFDFMAADLYSPVREEPSKNRVCESVTVVARVVWSLRPGARRLRPT